MSCRSSMTACGASRSPMPTGMSLPSFGSATSRGYQPTPLHGTAAMFRILILSAVLLVPTSLAAQRVTPVASYAVSTRPSLSLAARLDRTPLSKEIPGTYWLEGGIIGGTSVGVLSALYVRDLGASGERSHGRDHRRVCPGRCGGLHGRRTDRRPVSQVQPRTPMTLMTPPSNTRLKLTAPFVYCRIPFVIIRVWRRSLGAIR